MEKPSDQIVTMRVRIGDSELEVTGPVDFVEKKIAEFTKNAPKQTAVPTQTERARKTVLPRPVFQEVSPEVGRHPRAPRGLLSGKGPQYGVHHRERGP